LTKDIEPTDNVKAFRPKVFTSAENLTNSSPEELLNQGLEVFEDEMGQNPKGFFSVIFDKKGDPKIIWAGDIDMITALGALRMAEYELFATAQDDVLI
jgi:hypothetical protein